MQNMDPMLECSGAECWGQMVPWYSEPWVDASAVSAEASPVSSSLLNKKAEWYYGTVTDQNKKLIKTAAYRKTVADREWAYAKNGKAPVVSEPFQ